MSPWRVFWWAIIGGAAIIGTTMLAFPARSQTFVLCAPLPDLLTGLRNNMGEWIVMSADVGDGRRVFVTRASTGSWSVIVSPNEDVGCLVLAGSTSDIERGL